MRDVKSDGKSLDRDINIPESENVLIPPGNMTVAMQLDWLLTVAMLTHVHALMLVVGTSHSPRYVIWLFAVKYDGVIFLLKCFFSCEPRCARCLNFKAIVFHQNIRFFYLSSFQ